jgi:hypothetical protein
MSTENKKKVLLGFGAFAVVLIAVLAIWRPPAFRSEDASGSIGAVQKHHAPQITPQDVILGNETTKHEQQIRYADFLNDAAKLRSLSAMITANKFDAAAAEIAAMKAEARSSFVQEAKAAVAAAQALAKESSNRDAESKIGELSAILQNGQLSDADLANFNTKLEALSQRLAVKSAAERAAAAKSQIDAALAEMRSDPANATAKIDNTAKELKAMNAITLADQVDYLKATEVESKALIRAQAGIMGQPMASALSANADALEMRAAKAMDSQLNLMIVVSSAVRDIDAKLAEARGAVASAAGSQVYEKAYQAFAGTKAAINAQVNASVNAELYALNNYLDSSAAQAGSRTPALNKFLGVLAAQLNSNSALAATLAHQEDMAARAEQMVNQKTAQKSAAKTSY